MIFDITQKVSINPETRGIITGVLEVSFYQRIHYSFDNYLLIHAYPKEEALNPLHDRICFLVQRLPSGTLPAEDVRENLSGPYHLCVMDISNGKIVAELAILEPFDFKWDKVGRSPIPNPERGEYARACTHMNTGGMICSEDPVNDPERLEHYLFDYDPRYVRGESPEEYANRMRNEYRRRKAESARKPEPESAPTPTPAPEPAPKPTPAPEPPKTPTQAPRWLLMLPFILFMLIVLVVYLVRNH